MQLSRIANRLAIALASATLFAPPAAAQTSAAAPIRQTQQTLLFVGDVMLSRSVGKRMEALKNWKYPFEKIADTLRVADLTYANLECPVSDTGTNQHHLYSFRADPRVVDGLKFAGFDVLGLANNHIYDWGRPALLDTVHRLREAGLRPVGAGANELEAHTPVIVNLKGVRVAFLAYVSIPPEEATAGADEPGVAWLLGDRVLGDIRFARPLADVLIVCLHWGTEYAPKPDSKQVELAHQMIDAGADLIVGGHPHVVQPCELYHGRWIAYSLGNFIFDQHWPSTHHGLMLRVTLTGKEVTDATPIPITVDSSFQAILTPPVPPRQASRKPRTAIAQ